MKKIICFTLAIIILITVCAMTIKTNNNEYYTKNVKVVEINNDEIITVDNNGNLWAFYDNNNFSINQNLVIRLNTNNTTTIYDDIIEGIDY